MVTSTVAESVSGSAHATMTCFSSLTVVGSGWGQPRALRLCALDRLSDADQPPSDVLSIVSQMRTNLPLMYEKVWRQPGVSTFVFSAVQLLGKRSAVGGLVVSWVAAMQTAGRERRERQVGEKRPGRGGGETESEQRPWRNKNQPKAWP